MFEVELPITALHPGIGVIGRFLDFLLPHEKTGCFRSIEEAKIFCRIRSYLSTCRKQGIKASHALNLLFDGKLPEFAEQE
jgi:hypothetical protein